MLGLYQEDWRRAPGQSTFKELEWQAGTRNHGINVAGSLPDMVRKRKKPSHLLETLRKDYQLLTPEERNQLKCLILGFYPTDTPKPHNPNMLRIGSGTLIEQFQKSLMEDEKIDKEEVWSAIRYLDPDEREKPKEANTTTIIGTLALLLIVGGVWALLWLRLIQP
jgi:hypothetical protein